MREENSVDSSASTSMVEANNDSVPPRSRKGMFMRESFCSFIVTFFYFKERLAC